MRVRLFRSVMIGAAMVLSGPTLAAADVSGGPKNVVMVVNEADDSTRSSARVAFSSDHDRFVHEENVAVARASCTDCRTAAVAIQLVLKDGQVVSDQPRNAAVAVNTACTACVTFAYARQWVQPTDHPVIISVGARARLQELEQQVDEVAQSVQSAETVDDLVVLEEALDALADQMIDVLEQEIGASTHPGWEHRNVQRAAA